MTHSIQIAACAAAAISPIVAQSTSFLLSGLHLDYEFAPAYDFCVSDCRGNLVWPDGLTRFPGYISDTIQCDDIVAASHVTFL